MQTYINDSVDKLLDAKTFVDILLGSFGREDLIKLKLLLSASTETTVWSGVHRLDLLSCIRVNSNFRYSAEAKLTWSYAVLQQPSKK